MALSPFYSWLQRRQVKPPEADRLVPIIAQAGASGMTRSEIGGVIDLDREALDELLDGLVRFGMLTVTAENGIRVYRVISI